MNLRTTIIFIFIFSFHSSFGQTKNDTINILKSQTKKYLTEMYVNKNFDKASKFLDHRIFLEMEDFYNKRKQGQLKGSFLHNRVKQDISKYYKVLIKFRFDKFLDVNIEYEDNSTFGYVFFEYTEFFKNKSDKIKTMLVFISENNGKSWVLQDFKIKDIADKVDKKIIN